MSTTVSRQKLELLTPALLAGAHQSRPEWRSASLHGQLHFWARILAYDPDPALMRRGEVRLTGGLTKGKESDQVAAPFAAWLEGEVQSTCPVVFTCPHDQGKGQRAAIPASATALLCWTDRVSAIRAGMPTEAQVALKDDFARLLRCWLLLGAIGLRSNRAAGSVWVPNWSPTIEQFEKQIGILKLSSQVEVSVLPAVTAGQLGDWLQSLRGREQAALRQAIHAEQLRGIATDTVGGRRDDIREDPLGYAGSGTDRKASPLKLKVGRFSDGYRLIAIHDKRNGRGGVLQDAIDSLNYRHKRLGQLLAARKVVNPAATPGSAGVPVAGTSAKEVADLLAGRLTYAKFGPIADKVSAWRKEGRLDLIAEFLTATQDPMYAGLRQQSWYPVANRDAASHGPEELPTPK